MLDDATVLEKLSYSIRSLRDFPQGLWELLASVGIVTVSDLRSCIQLGELYSVLSQTRDHDAVMSWWKKVPDQVKKIRLKKKMPIKKSEKKMPVKNSLKEEKPSVSGKSYFVLENANSSLKHAVKDMKSATTEAKDKCQESEGIWYVCQVVQMVRPKERPVEVVKFEDKT